MNRSDWLTDELIQAAFERRAGRAAPDDLRETILTLSAASSQRLSLRQQLRSTMSSPILRPTLLKSVAAATVIGVIAVGAAFFVTRPDQPAVGGPSPSPNATFSPSAPASPSVGPSAAVVAARAAAWTATGGMTEARTGHTATLLSDGKVLVAGGRDGPDRNGAAAATSAELYDPSSGTWSATGSMNDGRTEQTATLLQDGTVLVAGGCCAVSSAPQTAELYDPVSGNWTATADRLLGGEGRTATLLSDGKVLVVGGNYGPQRAVMYDPISGTGTATGGKLVTNRYYATATLLSDGRVLVAGGQLARRTRDASAELYDPSSGSWTATGNMKARRTEHTATLLADGRVLVAGGFTADRDEKPLVSAELYDPISGSWTATGNMVTARGGGYSVTVLPDGKVLVAGGFRSDGTGALASAELYDPGTGTWTAARNMDAPRARHTATLLPDGMVLVAGGAADGAYSDGKPLASAELYDPGGGN